MQFAPPLVPGALIRRYKRFLADVTLPDGRGVIATCPNTGSMLGCARPGSPVWLSVSNDPSRKHRYTWELVSVRSGEGWILVGINTGLPNRIVREAIEAGAVPELAGYESIRGEVAFGEERSRVDLLLSSAGRPPCYVEVKNVTAAVEDGVALFPDAVSERGAKHLRELARIVSTGARAVQFYCVQRGDVREVRPADAIDPAYGKALREAIAQGVEVIAYRAEVTREGIRLDTRIPVVCP